MNIMFVIWLMRSNIDITIRHIKYILNINFVEWSDNHAQFMIIFKIKYYIIFYFKYYIVF